MPAGNNKEQNVAAVQDTKENKKKLENEKEQKIDQNRESILENCGIIRRVRQFDSLIFCLLPRA